MCQIVRGKTPPSGGSRSSENTSGAGTPLGKRHPPYMNSTLNSPKGSEVPTKAYLSTEQTAVHPRGAVTASRNPTEETTRVFVHSFLLRKSSQLSDYRMEKTTCLM